MVTFTRILQFLFILLGISAFISVDIATGPLFIFAFAGLGAIIMLLVFPVTLQAATVYHVDDSAVGNNDGSDWANAFEQFYDELDFGLRTYCLRSKNFQDIDNS